MTSLAHAPSTTDAVRVTGIGKRLPGVIANHDISFTIPASVIRDHSSIIHCQDQSSEGREP